MAAYITVLNCVFILSCVADVADCPLQRLSAFVKKDIIIIIIIIILDPGTEQTQLNHFDRGKD